MKSKNIPEDIKKKSIKEAQNEIKEIINGLENKDAILDKSIDKYKRMLDLNYHIQEEFKKKAKLINASNLTKDSK
jgi:exonuclease VII small subunit